MNAALAAAVARAAAASPQSNGDIGTVQGRLLLADGDGLCYYCAGNDDTAPGQARINLIDKLRAAQAACGAESIKILVTARGSHKGHRYAVARVKPYQGQREGSRRPKNWAYLRELLEVHGIEGMDVEQTDVAEADDLFSRYGASHPDCVIYTQDKDMRMVPGLHLDWLTHVLFKLEPTAWRANHGDKLWGRAWFWSQMLHGDTADNIPGLPYYTDGSILKSGPKKGEVKEIRCGEASELVKRLIPMLVNDTNACTHIRPHYESCYGDRWLVEMLEQGILLWMRTDQQSSPFDVCAKGNPMHTLTTHEQFPAARQEILLRIAEATIHESDQTENDRGGGDAIIYADGPSEPLRGVPVAVLTDGSGARPRPHDGGGASSTPPIMQRPAGQGGEQLPPVRREEPVGLPGWHSLLLAKA
jgi:hypothetical protein